MRQRRLSDLLAEFVVRRFSAGEALARRSSVSLRTLIGRLLVGLALALLACLWPGVALAEPDASEDVSEGDPSELMDMSPDELRKALVKAAAIPKPESGPFLLEGLAALRQTGKEQGIGVSVSSLQQEEQLTVFEAVLDALFSVADERLLDELTAMAGSKDRTLSHAAIRLMGLAGGEKAVPTLLKMAEAEDRERRTLALLALGDTKAESALAALEKGWEGAERLAAKSAAERLRWQLGRSEPKPRGQKTGKLVYWGLEKSPATDGWQIDAQPLGQLTPVADLPLAQLVVLDAGKEGNFRQWSPDDTAAAFGKLLSAGGTLVCLCRETLRHRGLSAVLAKLNIEPPQQWEPGEIACRARYEDFHPILTSPYRIEEMRGSVQSTGGWSKRTPAQRAPFGGRTKESVSPVVFQCVGNGTVIFSAIDLLGDPFLRENLYATALGPEFRRPKGFVWELSQAWETVHRKWAKPGRGEKPRVLFLMPNLFARGIVEIAQRLDMTYAFVPLLTTVTKGAKKGYETQTQYTLSGEAIEELQCLLGKPWDLIVVGNLSIQGTGYYATFGWRDVPLHLKRVVRDRVLAGTGLAFLSPGSDGYLGEGRQLGVNPSWPIAVGGQNVAASLLFPFDKPSLTLMKLRKGRICFLNSALPFMALWDQAERERPEGLAVPGVETARVVFPTEEYRYAALVKTLLWAAGRDFGAEIAKLGVSPVAPHAGKPFVVEVALSGAPLDGCSVEATVWDRFNSSKHAGKQVVAAGKSSIEVPGLAEGAYVADCVLRNAAGEALDWAAFALRVQAESRILSAEADKEFYEPGDRAKVRVKIAGGEGLRLGYRVIDTYGRVTHQGNVPAKDSVELTLSLQQPLARLHYLWLELQSGAGKAVSVHRQPLLVRLDPPDDYRWYQAGGSSSSFAEQLAAAGVDCINLPLPGSDLIDVALERNMGFWSAWSQIGAGYAGLGNAEGTAHSLCPSGPGFRYGLRKNLEESVPRARKYGVKVFMLQDESSPGIGRCDALPCVFAFQYYLRGLYGTVERLNQAWKQEFKDWDEVRFVPAKDAATLAPQVDHAMFMRRAYAEWIDQSQGGIRRFIPDARVGFSVSWGDSWELSRYLSMTIWHRGIFDYDPHVSYGQPGIVFGTWYGPTYTKSDRNEAQAHHEAWSPLLGGANAFFEWWGARHLGYNFVRPDLSLFKIATTMSEQVAETKAGVGKLLMESEFATLPVVVYESSRSGVACAALAKLSNDPEAQKRGISGIPDTLRRLQIPVRYVHSEQVEDGILAKDDIRLVLMSREMAVSDAEIEALRLFVANGGILVADYDIGLRDEHGNLRAEMPLAGVFGVKFVPGQDIPVPAGLAVEKDHGQLRFTGLKGNLPRNGFGANLGLTTGQALATIGGKLPVLVVNSHGKGLAVYLNFNPGLLEGEAGAKSLPDLLESLIAQAKIERPFTVVDAEGKPVKLRMGVFRSGDLRYVGFSADPEGNSLAEQRKMDVTLKSRQEGFLYDVRRRQSLGKTKEHRLTLTPGWAELFSLLPYSVERIDVTAAGDGTPPGTVAHVEAKLATSAQKPGKHVLALRVVDPTGRKRPEHDRNLVDEAGRCGVDIPVALNDPPGKWTVTLRDVATGVTGTAVFQVAD